MSPVLLSTLSPQMQASFTQAQQAAGVSTPGAVIAAGGTTAGAFANSSRSGIYEGGADELYEDFFGLGLLAKKLIGGKRKKKISNQAVQRTLALQKNRTIQNFASNMMVGYDGELTSAEEYDGIFGIAIGKKAKERLAAKRDLRAEAKRARIYNVKSKADSRLSLAQQGIKSGSGLGDVVGGVTSLASSLMGGGGGTPAEAIMSGGGFSAPAQVYTPQATIGEQQTAGMYGIGQTGGIQRSEEVAPEPAPAKNKNLPFIIGGVVLLIAVVVMAMMRRR